MKYIKISDTQFKEVKEIPATEQETLYDVAFLKKERERLVKEMRKIILLLREAEKVGIIEVVESAEPIKEIVK